MRVFQKFPKEKNCPICKTNKDEECVLIAISGTNKDGGLNFEAEIFHLRCLEPMLIQKAGMNGEGIIIQVIP